MQVTNHWIFQAVPKRYDLSKNLIPDTIEDWYVGRYRDQYQNGDVIYFWQAGESSGLYGKGIIVGSYNKEAQTVPIRYDIRFNDYIPRETFIKNKNKLLRELLIIKAPRGMNFKLNNQEAEAIEELISNSEQKLSSNDTKVKDIEDRINITEEISVKKAFDKKLLNQSSNEVFKIAEGLKLANGSNKIHMVHLFWALYSVPNSATRNLLRNSNIEEEILLDTLRGSSKNNLLVKLHATPVDEFKLDSINLSDHTFEAVSSAYDIAASNNYNKLKPYDLIKGFFSVTDCPLVQRILSHGIEPTIIEQIVDTQRDIDTKSFYLANKAARDVWTTDDKLEYRNYSKAISKPILDGITVPPLTIAIQAPWGQGKTSLMRMIREELENKPQDDEKDKTDDPKTNSSTKKASFNDLYKWLDDQSQIENMLGASADKIPTVWFNPLYYQEKEQIWAGMAHAILTQLTERFDSFKKREEFWLRLQKERLNKEAIRRDFHKLIIEDFLPKAGLYLIAAIVIFIISFLNNINILSFFSLLPIGKGLIDFNSFKKNMDGKNLQGKFEAYVSEPNYNDKLGFLHLVDHDIDKALDLLVGKEKIVVFIDDLDRCSPDVISEVILAINQFISLKSRKVIFILGMDTELVAQSIESVYGHLNSKNQSKIINDESEIIYQRSFGWQFMDKFIQVPFTIPRLTRDKAKDYMKDLLTEFKDDKLNFQENIKEDNEYENKLMKATEQATTTEQIRDIAKEVASSSEKVKNKVMSKVSEKLSEIVHDPKGEETERLIEISLHDLDLNPRTMKRFLNLVRLYRHIHILSNPTTDDEESRKLIVRTAHLMLNWMPFVRLLQEEEVLELQDNKNPDNILTKIEDSLVSSKDFEDWKQRISKESTIKNIIYLYDKNLYSFLNRITKDPPKLSNMREVGFI